MSTYEEMEYFMEAAGFDHGPECLIAIFLVVSVVCGTLIAQCILSRNSQNSETKQARKVLANVLNEGRTNVDKLTTSEDDMFDVPLNDDKSYVGPTCTVDNGVDGLLASETRYERAPSRPGKKSQRSSRRQSNNLNVGNLVEDEEYSFEVEL